MAYTLSDRVSRMCQKEGCGLYSCMGSSYCHFHGGRKSIGSRRSRICYCGAYRFAHKCSGGRCRETLSSRVPKENKHPSQGKLDGVRV